MRKLRYHLVDVFTDRPFGGNQLAVFTDGRDVPAELMQTLARELNLSETTFVLPPDDPNNHYKVRIFTPATELPMAGHPTVGTSYVLAREQLIDRTGDQVTIRLEEGVGPIPVDISFTNGSPSLIWMTQLPPVFGPQFSDAQAVAEILSLDVGALRADLPFEVASCGVPFFFVPLRDLQAIRNIRLNGEVTERILASVEASGVFIFTQEVERGGSTVHSRMFAPGLGVTEDPATGAASGPLGCYLVKNGLVAAEPVARIVSEQGVEMGRPSIIRIEIEQSGAEITKVRVGGECRYIGEGVIEVEDL
jgi:trans-2,3-dihydro-3-hydroxyanthranilate isomerase